MKLKKFGIGMMVALGSSGLFAQTQTIHVAGQARTYVLHAPSGISHPPLVLVLHGFGMDGRQQEELTQMDKIADREKFIVAYPNAVDKAWDQTGKTDFTFFLAILDSLDAKYLIDRNRIYVAGFSQGAGLTHAVGCGYSETFAAIAPVSGNVPANCAPNRPMPVFLTFGTKDIATPEKFMSSAETWAKLDGCPSTPTVMHPYPSSNPNSVVTRIVYGPCDNGTEVIADSIQGGPHEWPMDTRTKVNNSEEVWAFFKKFALNRVSGIPRQTVSAIEKNLSAAYFPGEIRLHGVGEKSKLRVLDNRGRLVLEATAGSQRIAFSGKPRGVYQVVVSDENRWTVLRMVIP